MTDSSGASNLSSSAFEQQELFPIREVSRLTGVNPVTLRAWERRYGLIRPTRTDSGHRLYSMADVEAVRSILSWTERGVDATYWSWRLAGHGRWAAPLGWRPLRPLLLLGYQLFAVLRPHLEWLPHPDGASRCTTECDTAQNPSPRAGKSANHR